MRIKAVTYAAVVVGLFFFGTANVASALDYPGTCRGPSAVVTSIADLDTRFAIVTAKQSRVDAEMFCRSEYAVGKSVPQCVSGLMRITYKATANCFAGTLETVSSDLPKPDYSRPVWRNSYRVPIPATCGNDGNQAIALFRMLCPNFRGQVEE